MLTLSVKILPFFRIKGVKQLKLVMFHCIFHHISYWHNVCMLKLIKTGIQGCTDIWTDKKIKELHHYLYYPYLLFGNFMQTIIQIYLFVFPLTPLSYYHQCFLHSHLDLSQSLDSHSWHHLSQNCQGFLLPLVHKLHEQSKLKKQQDIPWNKE